MKLSPVRWLLVLVAAVVVLFGVIQLVPYGRDHTNPPATLKPAWNSPRTEELARTACYDCHSNETTWPWYSNIAPMSWLVMHDVEEARAVFNFNTMTPSEGSFMVNEMVEKIQENEMPPSQYLIIHTNARFSASEKQELIDGLQATYTK
jgi:hypothetical protein